MSSGLTDPAGNPIDPTHLPSGEDIYNVLMKKIEPELVLSVIPTLDDKYANETPEENAARLERYRQAYALYDEAFKHWSSQLQGAAKTARRDALKEAEEKEKQDEAKELDALESAFE